MLSKILIAFGLSLILFGFHLVYERYSPNKFEFENFVVNAEAKSQLSPVRMIISSAGIDQTIYPAEIKNGKWSSTKEGVSHLDSSPIPGEKGNSIIYGHNWPNVIGNLVKVKPGDKIEIMLSDSSVKTFEVRYTSIVEPTETSIVSKTNDIRLTVYTCTGFLDSKRFVVTAFLNSQ
jgi:LPXTG-site transpeptidase (sortase) family protein